MAYRNAPHCTTNESQAKLFMGRSLPSRLDLMRPDVRKKVELKQAEERERRNSTLRAFGQGQVVAVRDYRQDHSRWTPGTIMAQSGPLSYSVKVASGEKRHADKIRSSNIPMHQDTDVQFYIPIVNPAILPHDSSIPNVEPLATPTSNGS